MNKTILLFPEDSKFLAGQKITYGPAVKVGLNEKVEVYGERFQAYSVVHCIDPTDDCSISTMVILKLLS